MNFKNQSLGEIHTINYYINGIPFRKKKKENKQNDSIVLVALSTTFILDNNTKD